MSVAKMVSYQSQCFIDFDKQHSMGLHPEYLIHIYYSSSIRVRGLIFRKRPRMVHESSRFEDIFHTLKYVFKTRAFHIIPNRILNMKYGISSNIAPYNIFQVSVCADNVTRYRRILIREERNIVLSIIAIIWKRIYTHFYPRTEEEVIQ